jgi:hypothetical protein
MLEIFLGFKNHPTESKVSNEDFLDFYAFQNISFERDQEFSQFIAGIWGVGDRKFAGGRKTI